MSNLKAVILKGEPHIKDNGTCNIKIRITHLRKVDYISTNLYVLPDSFDSKDGVIKSGRNKAGLLLRGADAGEMNDMKK